MIFSKQVHGKAAIRALTLTIGLLAMPTRGGWGAAAYAASPQTQQQLNEAIQSLQVAGSAYSAGNASEARRAYDKAKTSWANVEPSVNRKEARELRELFETLNKQLSKEGAADDVKSTITDMTDELREKMK